jgi:orotidine-5'-phosphate decarboxylase
LDLPSVETALALVERLAPWVGAFKVGSELFTLGGPDIVRRVRARGTPVFLDLKFHDIPNTVAKAVEAAVRLDVQMLSVHTSGGPTMLRAAEKAAQETARKLGRIPPLILGVTVLTSLDTTELAEIGFAREAGQQVERLALLAAGAGLRGLVCSPLEIGMLRRVVPPQVQLVTPGIRSGDDAKGDQKRTLSAAEALQAGANWLVIGRPIYAAPDPVVAARRLLDGLG